MSKQTLKQWQLFSLGGGSVVWLAMLYLNYGQATVNWLVESLFLLAPLIIVPLALPLCVIPQANKQQPTLYYWLIRLQPIAALSAALSFTLPKGVWAACFAILWFLFTGLMALWGVAQLFQHQTHKIAEISINIGLIFSVVGGGWLVISRFGLRPLDFADIIVLLTAIHFHYAGFATSIISGNIGRKLTIVSPTLLPHYTLIALSIITAPIIVAIGITSSPLIELGGVILTVSSLVGLAYLIGNVIIKTTPHKIAQLLFIISIGSVLIGMFFASLYAISEYTGTALINIPQMAQWHGVVNSLGFVLCSLIGLNIAQLTADR